MGKELGAGALILAAAIPALLLSALAQPASEHESHHPGAAATTGATSSAPPTAGAGGMGEMEHMAVPPARELYAELMRLEEVTPEQRSALIARAHARREAGAAHLADGVTRIDAALRASDSAALSEAIADARAGLAELESGLATTEALRRGDAPRALALRWFREEMSLGTPEEADAGVLGVGWFHLAAMSVLVLFALAMIAMYFHKMRRASALLGALTGSGSPPPAGGAELPPGPRSPPPAPPSPSAPPSTTAGPAAPTAPSIAITAPAPSAPSFSFESLRKTGDCKRCKEPCSVRMRVVRVFAETPSVKTFRLTAIDGGALPFDYAPGQYLNVAVPASEAGGAATKRSYTIASSPTRTGYCEITVKRESEGVVSRFLHDRVREGAELRVSAAYGRFCFMGEGEKNILLIAGGVGVTPLMSVIRYLTDRSWPGEIALLFCFRTPADFIFGEELAQLARRHPNLRLVPVVSGDADVGWTGRTGRITKELIREAVPDVAARLVHLCGPKAMMDATRGFLEELGVPRARIRFEAFGPAAPVVPPAPIAPSEALTLPVVSFTRSGKSAPLPPERTVLEAAESISVAIDWSCRSGTCGSCAVKLISGKVTMEVDDGLDDEDRAAGMILACQARATADVAVEA